VGSKPVVFLDKHVDLGYNSLGCGRTEPVLKAFSPCKNLDCTGTYSKDVLLEMTWKPFELR